MTTPAPNESTFQVFVTDECRADQAEARRIARHFDEMLRQSQRPSHRQSPGQLLRQSLGQDTEAGRRERRGGRMLGLEWFALVFVTYAIVFAVHPVALKIALLVPWSLYSSLALDNITHYANHWPLFRSRLANALWRASGALVFFNPLEIRAIHNDHHRAYARADNDERVFAASDRGRSFAAYLAMGALDGLRLLWPHRAMDRSVKALRERRPAHYREVVAMRFAMPGWLIALVALDARDTLLCFVPAILMVGSLGSLVMNLTDHIPGNAHHPFRLATFLEPATAYEALLSRVNHHTAATHLTHHLFPTVHWAHLPHLQRLLAPIYRRHGAPRSLLVNSTLIGNPVAFARVLRELARRRFDLLDAPAAGPAIRPGSVGAT